MEELVNTDSPLQTFVKHPYFDGTTIGLLFSYAILIGVQIDNRAANGEFWDSVAFQVLDGLYSLAFLVELIIRIKADGIRSHLCSLKDAWAWNWFDTIVVIFGVTETCVGLLAHYVDVHGGEGVLANVTVVRVARIARAIKGVRLVRMMRFFTSLRIMTGAILGTLRSCAWALLLLALIMYVFGLVFVTYTLDYLDQGHLHYKDDLLEYFGSCGRTILTLFMVISGGMDWKSAIRPLGAVSAFCVVLFLAYVAFVYFAVLNVMTGIFLQSAIEQAAKEKDAFIQQRLAEREIYIRNLKELFVQLDHAHDGVITLNEFEESLQEERMQAFFQSIEIETTDAWTIFKLLDADGEGTISLHEFIEGCLRIKGNAKSIHIAQILYENKWIMEQLGELTEACHAIGEVTMAIRKSGIPPSNELMPPDK